MRGAPCPGLRIQPRRPRRRRPTPPPPPPPPPPRAPCVWLGRSPSGGREPTLPSTMMVTPGTGSCPFPGGGGGGSMPTAKSDAQPPPAARQSSVSITSPSPPPPSPAPVSASARISSAAVGSETATWTAALPLAAVPTTKRKSLYSSFGGYASDSACGAGAPARIDGRRRHQVQRHRRRGGGGAADDDRRRRAACSHSATRRVQRPRRWRG